MALWIETNCCVADEVLDLTYYLGLFHFWFLDLY